MSQQCMELAAWARPRAARLRRRWSLDRHSYAEKGARSYWIEEGSNSTDEWQESLLVQAGERDELGRRG